MMQRRDKASLLDSDGQPLEGYGEWRVVAMARTEHHPVEFGVMLHLGHPWLDDIGRTRDDLVFHGAISLSPENARKLAEALLLAANLSAPVDLDPDTTQPPSPECGRRRRDER
jgi:hypothetical protein